MSFNLNLDEPGWSVPELLSKIPDVIQLVDPDNKDFSKVKCLVCNQPISTKTSANLVTHLKTQKHIKKEMALNEGVKDYVLKVVYDHPNTFEYAGYETIKCTVCHKTLTGKHIDPKAHLNSQFHHDAREAKARQKALSKLSNDELTKLVVQQVIFSGLSFNQYDRIKEMFSDLCGRILPSSQAAKRLLNADIVPEIKDEMLTQLRCPGVKISIAVDEMTDAQGRLLAGVLVGIIKLEEPSTVFFYKLKVRISPI